MPTKTAIVTGAGSGIGRATAFHLAEMGHAVALVGRTVSKLESVASEIKSRGGETLILSADVSKRDHVERAVGKVAEKWNRVDVLVNNAGLAPSVPLADLDPALWQEILETNLSSAFYAIRAVWPLMKSRKSGAIINISSMAAKDPFPGLGAYAVAKIGINMLSLVTAREGDPFGIRVVAIAPAAVDTLMFRNLMGDQPVDGSQLLQPEDVAAAIADVVNGSLRYASGDTIYLHRRPA